jgi:outer membrane protein, heavy metal efflux system
VLKAQVELSTLAQELEILEQKKSSAESQIQYLLGRGSEAPLGEPTELKRSPILLDLPALLSAIKENSPRLRAEQFLIDSRAVGVERSKKEFRPDFALNFEWQRTGSQYPDYYMATAEVKFPLYSWRKQRLGAEEAHSRLKEAEESYRSTQQELDFMVKDQFLIAKTSERLLSLYESGTIPQATLALESTTSAYEVGKVDFLTLLGSFTSVLSLEKQYYEELARHEEALARIEPLVGRELVAP